MKTFPFFALLLLALLSGSCKEEDNTPCQIDIAVGTRFFEFAHRGTDYTFYAWTNKASVIENVEAQLALPEDQRGQHINGKIARLPAGCDLNKDWSWYFPADDWDVADISIELCDGNPQYVEENLQDYLDIQQYCPWGSYVLREINKPF